MVAISSKRVLVVCPDIDSSETALGYQIADLLEQGNVPVLSPSPTEINWGDIKDVKNYFAVHQPQVVLCALPLGTELFLRTQDANVREVYRATLANVAQAASMNGSAVIFLSDYHVFGGEAKSSYSHSDEASPLDEFGRYVLSLEQLFAEHLEKFIVLRFSWLIDIVGDNLLTQTLKTIFDGGTLHANRRRRGSPTWQQDALRVIHGVLRQIMAGATNWGVFHYCSADSCSEYEFASEVHALLSDVYSVKGQVESVDTGADVVEGHYPGLLEPASAVLACTRIKNNFGAHGRSWRQGLTASVNRWLELQGVSVELKEAGGA
ncbi:sugar nucleotide-binding protein [Aurantivibrio plasticivorans]